MVDVEEVEGGDHWGIVSMVLPVWFTYFNILLFKRALAAADMALCVEAERLMAGRHCCTMLCGRERTRSVFVEAWRMAGVRRLVSDRRSSVKE